jgi:site-specific DNA recombinase
MGARFDNNPKTQSLGYVDETLALDIRELRKKGFVVEGQLAASKKKGLWMGGQVPLGYRVEQRKLVVQESEAEVVRTIFRHYQELGRLGPPDPGP